MTQVQILGFLQLIFIGICIYYVDYREKKEIKRIEELNEIIASYQEFFKVSSNNLTKLHYASKDILGNMIRNLEIRVESLEEKLK